MKTTGTIRILAGLSLLILMCPFFQMCSDKDIASKVYIELEPLPNDSNNNENQEAEKHKRPLCEQREDYTLNAYQISYAYITAYNNGLGHWRDLKQAWFYAVVFFILSVIMALPILIMALLKKSRWVFIFSCLNMAFIVLYTLIFIIDDTILNDFWQIKIGYYLFVLNSIALIFVSYKAWKQSRHAV